MLKLNFGMRGPQRAAFAKSGALILALAFLAPVETENAVANTLAGLQGGARQIEITTRHRYYPSV